MFSFHYILISQIFPGIPKTEEKTKSNAELKAERRAKQEAQRAAKAAGAAGQSDSKLPNAKSKKIYV